MRVLFIHPNMPGQFKHLAKRFGDQKDMEVVFLTKPRPHVNIPGVRKIEYKPPREPAKETHPYLHPFERGVLEGQQLYRVCLHLREEGFVPDVIVAHPGWGGAMYMKDVFPNSPLLSFFEFYYHAEGSDVGFDPKDPITDDTRARIRTKNATLLYGLQDADWGISPTFWQRNQHPQNFWHKISVLHDGVDIHYCKPDPKATFELPNGTTVSAKDKVVTYIARNLEPYRGFPTFMEAARKMLDRDSDVQIIAIGGDEISYGKPAPKGTTYREMYCKEYDLADHPRLHFVGRVPYKHLINLFQLTRAHLYLTYPFVLSWSTLEAMACGANLVASATPPVQEVITDEVNGRLVDFFDAEQVATTMLEVAGQDDKKRAEFSEAARQTIVERYALESILPMQEQLIKDLGNGQLPPRTAKTIVDWNRANMGEVVNKPELFVKAA